MLELIMQLQWWGLVGLSAYLGYKIKTNKDLTNPLSAFETGIALGYAYFFLNRLN